MENRENIKKAIVVMLALIFLFLANPWTFDSLINRIEPWVGPLPWSIFITYGLLIVTCALLASYQKLEDM